MFCVKPAAETVLYMLLIGMLVLLNILFFLFTFQRHFYFFGWCNKESPENIRVRSVVSKDRNEVELYLFDRGSRKDLVYMAGNNITMKEYLDFCEFLFDTFDCNVISMAYRGINESSLVPSEKGIVEDIRALAQYLDKRTVVDQHKRPVKTGKVVLGFSIGSAAGIHLASMCSVDSLVLINPFMSLPSAVNI